ncbi:hypothetical protein KQH82_13440 [bacterium]|nr:hypothetical protein [bacterium]
MLPTAVVLSRISRPPTRSDVLHCKQVRLELLGNEERDYFERMFPRFFEDAQEHPRRRQAERLGLRCEEPYNERRFGVRGLPRGNYYTLCSPETGFSQQTLAMELLAYAIVPRDFVVEAIDVADPAAAELLSSIDSEIASRCKHYQNRCIVVVERQLQPNAGGLGSPRGMVIPYRIAGLNRQMVLDLRQRDAMEWLLRILWEYFPGTLFLNVETNPPRELGDRNLGSALPPVRFMGDPRQLERVINSSEAGKFDIRNCGLGAIFGNRHPFLTLLQLILNPALGGTSVDDIIGELLVAVGVDCLVYPSARHDCGAYYDGSDLVAHIGWHAVDYSSFGSSPNHLGTYMIDDLESYLNILGSIEFFPSRHAEDPCSVDSWHLHGTAAATRAAVLRRAWQSKIELESTDFSLEPNVMVERTPWLSYTHGNMNRKPRVFENWFDVRLAIITKEINLKSFLLNKDRERTSIMVGDFLVALSQNHDLWGSGITATGFDEDDSFLTQNNGDIICPACGDLDRQLTLLRMRRCLRCGFPE